MKNGEETESHRPGTYWDFVKSITDDHMQMAVQEGFEKPSPQDRYFLENRKAICMICGYVKKKERLTFDNLGTVYNVTTADGAEQAYRKSMENLDRQMFKNEKTACHISKAEE